MNNIGRLPKRHAQLCAAITPCGTAPSPGRRERRNSLDPMSENFERVFRTAYAAGTRAAAAVTPPLMMVTDPDRLHLPVGPDCVSGLWFVPEGPAGMAMIVLQPATCRFARWLLKEGYAQRLPGRSGAVVFADGDGESQSLHRAAAWAMAVVSVIEVQNLGVRAEIVLRYG